MATIEGLVALEQSKFVTAITQKSFDTQRIDAETGNNLLHAAIYAGAFDKIQTLLLLPRFQPLFLVKNNEQQIPFALFDDEMPIADLEKILISVRDAIAQSSPLDYQTILFAVLEKAFQHGYSEQMDLALQLLAEYKLCVLKLEKDQKSLLLSMVRQAVTDKNIEQIDRYQASGVLEHIDDQFLLSQLLIVVMQSNYKNKNALVQRLLEKNRVISLCEGSQMGPLHIAIQQGQCDWVTGLLKNGSYPNQMPSEKANHPMAMAKKLASKNRESIIQVLEEYGSREDLGILETLADKEQWEKLETVFKQQPIIHEIDALPLMEILCQRKVADKLAENYQIRLAEEPIVDEKGWSILDYAVEYNQLITVNRMRARLPLILKVPLSHCVLSEHFRMLRLLAQEGLRLSASDETAILEKPLSSKCAAGILEYYFEVLLPDQNNEAKAMSLADATAHLALLNHMIENFPDLFDEKLIDDLMQAMRVMVKWNLKVLLPFSLHCQNNQWGRRLIENSIPQNPTDDDVNDILDVMMVELKNRLKAPVSMHDIVLFTRINQLLNILSQCMSADDVLPFINGVIGRITQVKEASQGLSEIKYFMLQLLSDKFFVYSTAGQYKALRGFNVTAAKKGVLATLNKAASECKDLVTLAIWWVYNDSIKDLFVDGAKEATDSAQEVCGSVMFFNDGAILKQFKGMLWLKTVEDKISSEVEDFFIILSYLTPETRQPLWKNLCETDQNMPLDFLTLLISTCCIGICQCLNNHNMMQELYDVYMSTIEDKDDAKNQMIGFIQKSYNPLQARKCAVLIGDSVKEVVGESVEAAFFMDAVVAECVQTGDVNALECVHRYTSLYPALVKSIHVKEFEVTQALLQKPVWQNGVEEAGLSIVDRAYQQYCALEQQGHASALLRDILLSLIKNPYFRKDMKLLLTAKQKQHDWLLKPLMAVLAKRQKSHEAMPVPDELLKDGDFGGKLHLMIGDVEKNQKAIEQYVQCGAGILWKNGQHRNVLQQANNNGNDEVEALLLSCGSVQYYDPELVASIRAARQSDSGHSNSVALKHNADDDVTIEVVVDVGAEGQSKKGSSAGSTFKRTRLSASVAAIFTRSKGTVKHDDENRENKKKASAHQPTVFAQPKGPVKFKDDNNQAPPPRKAPRRSGCTIL